MQAPETSLRRAIGVWDLVLFNIAVVAGIRWFGNAAHAGSGVLILWGLGALLFFLPSAILFSGLSRQFPQEGGFYNWIREAFGEWPAYLSTWLYSIGVLFLFPSLLLAGAGVAVSMLGEQWTWLADNRAYVLLTTLGLLWAITLANIFGIDPAKWVSNFGGAATYSAFAVIVCGAVVVYLRRGPATEFHFWPTWNFDTVNFWAQLAYALTGLEMGGIVGSEIRDPRRTIPRAAYVSGALCTAFYVAGTGAMLVLLRPSDVNPMVGLAQAGTVIGSAVGLSWIPRLLAGLVTIGMAGQLGALLTANSRLPYVIGLARYLPPAFARLHPRWHTPYVSILVQAGVSTVALLVLQSGETLRAAYQILIDMAILANAIPYMFMFAAGWKFGYRLSGALGFLVSVTTLVFSAVPGSDVSNVWTFELKVVGGLLLLIAAGRLQFSRARHSGTMVGSSLFLIGL